ncbi:MAG: type II toxin-antitoxin system VapC family toxin [Candidatus Saccharimonadales bacterium]
MIAFDSNVLIYVMGRNTTFQEQATAVFRQAAVEGGICSALVITESLYGSVVSLNQIPILLSPQITILPVNNEIAEKAGQLKIEHGLKNIDAIHIATAIYAGASTFITNDIKVYNKKVEGITLRGL